MIDHLKINIRTLLEQQEEKNYYKRERVSNFCNNNYIEYKSKGDKNRNLSLDEFLNKIKPYLRNIIIDLQNFDTWKIQLTVAINFISSTDTEKEHVMDSKSDNIKFISYNDATEVVKELFDSLKSRYQNNLETSMQKIEFTFDSVQTVYYKCHKVNFMH